MKELFSGIATLFSDTGKSSDGQLIISSDRLSFTVHGKTKEKRFELSSLKVTRAEVSQGLIIRRKKTAICLAFPDGQNITFIPEHANGLMVEALYQEIIQAIKNEKDQKPFSAPEQDKHSEPVVQPRKRRASITLERLQNAGEESDAMPEATDKEYYGRHAERYENTQAPIDDVTLQADELSTVGAEKQVQEEREINEVGEEVAENFPQEINYVPKQEELEAQAVLADSWLSNEKARRAAEAQELQEKLSEARREAAEKEQIQAEQEASERIAEEKQEAEADELQRRFSDLLNTQRTDDSASNESLAIKEPGSETPEEEIVVDGPLSIKELANKLHTNTSIIKNWMHMHSMRMSSNGVLSEEQQKSIINGFAANDNQLDSSTEAAKERKAKSEQTEEQPHVYAKTPRGIIEDRCRDLAITAGNRISSIREEPHKFAHTKSVAIDILNCQFVQLSDAASAIPTPLFAVRSQDEYYPCHQHGIYHEDLVSTYEALYHSQRKQIQSRIISDTIKNMPVLGSDIICIMPDTVDDFNSSFRKQCAAMFQVPRSIAAVYAQSVLLPKERLSNSVLCLDYDGEGVSAVQIERIDLDGTELLLRKGRKKILGDHPSYRSVAEEYLRQYQEKYQIVLPKKTINELINTKLIMQMVAFPEQKYVIDAEGQIICLHGDIELMDQVTEAVYIDALSISQEENTKVLVLFNYGHGERFYTTEVLQYGLQEILRRKQQGLTLWREYLPELKLEVIQDGTYAQIQLISGDMSQDIRNGAGYALDEEIEIKVDHGVIVLPANADDTSYTLPLERQTYGFDEPEKMAKFVLDEPLTEDKQVELRVYYRYGDESSYKLKAVLLDTGEEIESQWCDTEHLMNPVPTYSYSQQSPKTQDMDMLKAIFARLQREMQQTTRPLRMLNSPERNTTVYKEKKDLTNYLSKYLEPTPPYSRWDLKWPFKGVYSCFKRENEQAASEMIREMVNNGQLSCIGDVLNGRLPTGHKLDDKPTPESFSEQKILKNHLGDLIRQFGVMYSYTDADIPGISVIIEDILFYFQESRNRHIENWATISTYVQQRNDPYKIWPTLQKELRSLSNKPRFVVDELRGLSGVCYQTQDWVFSLYDSPNGPANIKKIVKGISIYLNGYEWQTARRYNLSKMRDVLELLLAICLLRKRDPLLLDCNDSETKQMVKQLKLINEELRDIRANKETTGTLMPRIKGIEVPAALNKVTPLIYALIQTLSGGRSVNLIGYSDD